MMLGLLGLLACRQDMHDNARLRPLGASSFFEDGRASRPEVPGTVARGHLEEDDHLYRGKVGDVVATTLPMPVTKELLERGRQRYDIYCAPCHDRTGDGQGMVVRRGFRRPPSFHQSRLLEAPVGHFYDVVTNGFGAMQDYRAQVFDVRDRWAIAAYVRVLQRTRHATLGDLPPEERRRLEEGQ
jgi:mono/diheme cytochrome c family protein